MAAYVVLDVMAQIQEELIDSGSALFRQPEYVFRHQTSRVAAEELISHKKIRRPGAECE